jgi:YVTN family beta-propeller protein
MNNPTRRLARALATSLIAFTALGGAQSLQTYQVGPQPDGSVVVPTNQFVTPAGTQINFAGRPLAIAVRPDGKTAAALKVGSSKPLAIVDLVSGQLLQEFSPGGSSGSYDGVVYSADGKRLYFSQDNGNVDVADVAADGTLTLNTQIKIPQPAGGVNNGGLALSADGKALYVVLNMSNAVGIIDLTTNTFKGQIAVGNAPHSIVLAGGLAYVTNEGGRPAKQGEYTDFSAGTPIVADPDSAASITGTVSVINIQSQTVVANIKVGLHPTAIVAANGFVFVANTNSDSFSVIDTATNKVLRTEKIKPFKDAPFGSSPNGLTFTSRDELAISLGANNAVAFYSWNGPQRRLKFEGFVPAAWYPASIGIAAQPKTSAASEPQMPERLIVANEKGVAVGSNLPDVVSGGVSGKNTHQYAGSVSVVPLPSPAEFEKFNALVAQGNGWDSSGKRPYRPAIFSQPSPIKHIFYIIKENRTYDQVLGDDPRGNGDPTTTQFGEQVTPNHHALADTFALFDNFYDCGVLSADGHQWTDQAFAPDYIEKGFTDFTRSYPFNGGDSLVYAPTGFLWMNALNHGLSVRMYGEYAYQFNGPSQAYGNWTDWYNDSLILEGKKTGTLHVPLGAFQAHSDVPSADKLLNRDFPPFDTEIPDQYRLDVFLRDFKSYVKHDNLPNLVIMTLCTDHTSGTSAAFPTPAAQVADNDLAVGRLVDTISHSPYWSSSAIFIVEDDPQAGVDHVDGHRSIAFVVSPYVQRKQVNHTYYTQVDMVRTIEDLLGLPVMTQRDLASPGMLDVFEDSANNKAFNVLPNQIPLDTLNPSAQASLQRAWQQWSATIFTHGPGKKPDTADPNLLNHAIWYANNGFTKPYPGEMRLLFPKQVPALEKPESDSDDKPVEVSSRRAR